MNKNKSKQCKFDGCNEEAKSRGYCRKHYTQMHRLGIFKEDISKNKNKKCSIPGCDKKYYGRGYCHMHYLRWKRHGDANYEVVDFHGLCKTREYKIWENMKERCYDKNNNAYKNYGGRGITVCDSWRNSFSEFIKDMGFCYDSNMQIDRINNNGMYEKNNCRWTTITQNSRNRRGIKLSMEKAREIRKKYAEGERVNKIAREYNVGHSVIGDVIRNKIWKEGAV